MPDQAGYALFMGSFVLRDDETLAGALEAFDEVSAAYPAGVGATDPGADMTAHPLRWTATTSP